MTDLNRIFAAGRVRRWHTNTALSWTDDYVDGHAGRVARLLLALHPAPTLALLIEALTHDDGEIAVGDLPGPVKARMSDAERHNLTLREGLAAIEMWEDFDIDVSALQEEDPVPGFLWIELCDRLDAWMWAAHKAPHVLTGDGWPEQRQGMLATAEALGCLEPVQALLGAAP